jgi:spore coat protein U-like protein
MTRLCAGICAFALLLAAPAARAAPPNCTATASGIRFGAYKPDNPAVAFTGSVRVICVGGAGTFTIALSAGASGSIAARTMQAPGGRLAYQLYTNAAHSNVWGDGTTGSVVGPITATVAVVTVYGLLFAGQHAPPGTYSDLVQAVVTY